MKPFNSPSYGSLDFLEVVEKTNNYIDKDRERPYRIIIGTDSQVHNREETDFVTALIIQRIGAGGIYFWQRDKVDRPYVLRDRIYDEAIRSMTLAQAFLENFNERVLEYDLEIHIDVGQFGQTRAIINEVVGMVRGNGFVVKIKPESYGASSVADRHT